MTDTSDTPWYVEHCKEPKGEYHTRPHLSGAATNPENRQGTVIHHHSKFTSTEIQDAISTALHALKQTPNRVFLLGGDIPDKGVRRYFHVSWDTTDQEYKIIKEGDRERTSFPDQAAVREALFDRFPDNAYVFPILIHTENSPFNLDETEDRQPNNFIAIAA